MFVLIGFILLFQFSNEIGDNPQNARYFLQLSLFQQQHIQNDELLVLRSRAVCCLCKKVLQTEILEIIFIIVIFEATSNF